MADELKRISKSCRGTFGRWINDRAFFQYYYKRGIHPPCIRDDPPLYEPLDLSSGPAHHICSAVRHEGASFHWHDFLFEGKTKRIKKSYVSKPTNNNFNPYFETENQFPPSLTGKLFPVFMLVTAILLLIISPFSSDKVYLFIFILFVKCVMHVQHKTFKSQEVT